MPKIPTDGSGTPLWVLAKHSKAQKKIHKHNASLKGKHLSNLKKIKRLSNNINDKNRARKGLLKKEKNKQNELNNNVNQLTQQHHCLKAELISLKIPINLITHTTNMLNDECQRIKISQNLQYVYLFINMLFIF